MMQIASKLRFPSSLVGAARNVRGEAAGFPLQARCFAGRQAPDANEVESNAGEKLLFKKQVAQLARGGKWMNLAAPPAVDPKMAERAAENLLKKPEKAAEILARLPLEQRRTVALSWALTELEEEFTKADKDMDGKLTYAEFKQWATQVIEHGQKRDEITPPSRYQLMCVFVTTLIPFVGFGAVDNGLMVIYGDMIDGTLGVMFGASMLASAALGNAISNIFGMLLHGTINKWAQQLGLPDPRLTLSQRKLPTTHAWSTAGSTVGVFVGCLLGMTPLLFMDQTKKEEERAHNKTHKEEEEKK